MEDRLQKILAHAGYGSRRSCEEIITAGRVRVNGKAIGLGDKADPARDAITVDGRPIHASEPLVYVALYKPRGVISTVTDPELRAAVRDLVPIPGTLYPVGRLDFDSEGLILLTNDGELTNRLTHPRYEHEKEYRVLVASHPDTAQLDTWRRGVVLSDGYRTRPATVYVEARHGKGAWLRVILKEGRKRQIREMGIQMGLPVARIIRIRIGELRLGNMKPKDWRYLTDEEIAALQGKGSAKPKPNARSKSKVATRSKPITAARTKQKTRKPRSRSES